MTITEQEVKYIAELSKLELDASASDKMKRELESIVEFMATLNKLDTENIEPLTHVGNLENVFRKDEVEPSTSREDILKNAKCRTEECFTVPKTVE
jgi:aspartyl-tRNA(Asn)/glutamyl-tRNA(Gln) amidotransferase subunit C